MARITPKQDMSSPPNTSLFQATMNRMAAAPIMIKSFTAPVSPAAIVITDLTNQKRIITIRIAVAVILNIRERIIGRYSFLELEKNVYHKAIIKHL